MNNPNFGGFYKMALMSDIKGDGHSLTAPRLSIGWAVYALVAIFILAIVATISIFAFKKASTASGLSSMVGNTSADVSNQNAMANQAYAGFL
jgi:hypothetical protein